MDQADESYGSRPPTAQKGRKPSLRDAPATAPAKIDEETESVEKYGKNTEIVMENKKPKTRDREKGCSIVGGEAEEQKMFHHPSQNPPDRGLEHPEDIREEDGVDLGSCIHLYGTFELAKEPNFSPKLNKKYSFYRLHTSVQTAKAKQAAIYQKRRKKEERRTKRTVFADSTDRKFHTSLNKP
ncbi:hypothetical protein H6P81_019029 [Aristolochia fimbriata]|uniref:Uncharacterized protein n=1 Tax=Aristolochia fimbriata TaxID=158543 RepID=A0AAV7E2L7_ARIFI|nr:hypothetical protein H6P81_019029 [Aristolochia fimbriata]